MVTLPCVEPWGAGGCLLAGWWAGCPPWRCTAAVSSVLGSWCCWTDRCHLETEPCRQTWPWCIHASISSEGRQRGVRLGSLSAPLPVTTTNPGLQARSWGRRRGEGVGLLDAEKVALETGCVSWLSRFSPLALLGCFCVILGEAGVRW